MEVANDNPVPAVTYANRISQVMGGIQQSADAVIPAEFRDQVHALPQQFQALQIMAFAKDDSGEEINFNLTSNSACLPGFSAFIMAQAASRFLATIAEQMGQGDPVRTVKVLDALRDTFMQHLMGCFGLGRAPGQPPAGEA